MLFYCNCAWYISYIKTIICFHFWPRFVAVPAFRAISRNFEPRWKETGVYKFCICWWCFECIGLVIESYINDIQICCAKPGPRPLLPPMLIRTSNIMYFDMTGISINCGQSPCYILKIRHGRIYQLKLLNSPTKGPIVTPHSVRNSSRFLCAIQHISFKTRELLSLMLLKAPY